MIYVWKSEVRDTPIHKVLKTQFKWAGKADQNPLHSKEVYIVRSAKEIDGSIIRIALDRLIPLGVPDTNIHLGDALDHNSYNF